MRVQLAERHFPKFLALTAEETSLVQQRLVSAKVLKKDDSINTGEELFHKCRSAGLDHAGVVLTLARETSPVGLSAIEHLIGHPIVHWHKNARLNQETSTINKLRGVAVPRERPENTMVVVAFVPNPKKQNTAGWERFKLWKLGSTVAECVAAGMWPADVKWDLDRGFVTLAAANSPEALALSPME